MPMFPVRGWLGEVGEVGREDLPPERSSPRVFVPVYWWLVEI